MNRERNTPFYIVLFACLLVVLGDLRNVITPLGYWGLWGALFCVGFLNVKIKKLSADISFLSATFGFIILIISIVVSSLINDDVYTAYQALKFLFIYFLFSVIYSNSQVLRINQFYSIASISTVVGISVFLLCKYIFLEYYILLGDGRQGSMFAYPGVLWKTSAFFIAFLLARYYNGSPSDILINSIFTLSSVYLLLADSSRTGFLWLFVVIVAFALSAFLANAVRFLSTVFILIFILLIIAVFNLDVIYSLLDSNSILVFNRFAEGDPIRSKMMTDGVLNAEACLPWGCGFQTSTSVVNSEPMVIHNVYLAILGDFGIVGAIGLLIIVFSPIVVFALREWFVGSTQNVLAFYKLAACLGAACYCFVLLFHPLSSEMSEWGYWAIMLSWLSRLSSLRKIIIPSRNE